MHKSIVAFIITIYICFSGGRAAAVAHSILADAASTLADAAASIVVDAAKIQAASAKILAASATSRCCYASCSQ